MTPPPLGRTDRILRIVLLLVAAIAAVASFVVLQAVDDQPAAVRFGAVAVPSTVAWWCISNTHTWDDSERRHPQEQLLRRRRGNMPSHWVPDDEWRAAEANPDAWTARVTDAWFAIRRRSSWWTVLGTSVAAGLAAAWSSLADRMGDVSFIGLYSSVAVAPLAAYAVRGLVRIALAGRAIHVDRAGVTLGPALGYVPSLHLDRREIRGVRVTPEKIRLLASGRRLYELHRSHLADDAALLRAMDQAAPRGADA